GAPRDLHSFPTRRSSDLMFVIGGLSGVTHAVVPSDWQQTDTYYIVAHFHYVIFGGSLFAFFGGFYYWYPKLRGRLMSEKLGKLQDRKSTRLNSSHVKISY